MGFRDGESNITLCNGYVKSNYTLRTFIMLFMVNDVENISDKEFKGNFLCHSSVGKL